MPPSVRELPHPESAIELDDTPFHPQERYQCGPAALTTVLAQSGAGASLEAVVDKVYLPGRQGSLQAELLAATRTEGRLPYVIDASLRRSGGNWKRGGRYWCCKTSVSR